MNGTIQNNTVYLKICNIRLFYFLSFKLFIILLVLVVFEDRCVVEKCDYCKDVGIKSRRKNGNKLKQLNIVYLL